MASSEKSGLTYAQSGVSIEEGDRFASLIRQHMRRTHGPRVLSNDGGFAGLLRLDHRQGRAAGGHFYEFECKLFSAPSVLGHG